jgi:hypothetical protein
MDCFKAHSTPDHKITMLQTDAEVQLKIVEDDLNFIYDSIAHINQKIELRRNLQDKKQKAASQFFYLIH